MTTPEDPGPYGAPQYPPPGGEQPQYPPLGLPPQYGQPQYGVPQYGQPQYGQPQYGAPQYGPPTGGPPPYPQGGIPAYATGGGSGAYGVPPKKSRKRLLFIALGVVVALIIAIVVAAVVLTKDRITDIDDASVGDCITVTGAKDDATPKSSTCGAEAFTFIVAQKLDSATGSCQDSQYSELTQRNKGKLCLIPNLKVGKCYQFPAGSNGGFSDFKIVDCSEPDLPSDKPVIKVTDRVDSTELPTCTGETLTFDLPKPLGYCGEVLTPQ